MFIRGLVFAFPKRSTIIATYVLHPPRLVGHCRISRHHAHPWPVVSQPLGQEHRRLLRFWTQRELVASRHLDGRHHLRRRHAASRHRPRLHAGHLGQLAVVGFPFLRNDDGLPLRAAVAAVRPAHRCAVCRDSLLRQAGGVSPRLSRHLSRSPHELRHPRMGHQGDDLDHQHYAGQHADAHERQCVHVALWLRLERQ